MAVPLGAARGVSRVMWWFALAAVVAMGVTAAPNGAAQSAEPLSIRITSPLGRTGAAAVVRIVAQVQAAPGVAINPVRIFVDNVLLGEVADGPPWALEWTDENPFAPREIAAEVTDAMGRNARDVVFLQPFEVIEKAEVSSVLLETTVVDGTGRFVRGIPPAAFSVFEDEVEQALDLVRSETLPATYTLLVDSSQSMSRRIEFVRDAAWTLAGYLRPQDRIIVAPFTKTLGAVTGPTDDRQTVSDALRSIVARGGTAILDGLYEASGLIAGMEGRHAIVLITDGYDEHSTRSFEDVLTVVQRSGASVYVVGIGGVAGISLRGERLLRRLATETGGRAFFPSREIELRPVHEQVASDVQLRYLLSYTPSNQKVDGTWRRISVATTDPTWVVRTRPGYFAPKPPPVRPAIEFTMVDANRQLLNVSAGTLRVFEDGLEQQVEVFQEAVSPVSIVFALDTSGSMRRVADDVKAAARSFVQALRPQDPLGLILFSDKALFAHDISTVRKWSLEAIDRYQAVGGTALYDAVYNALMRLRGIEGRRVVVVMTDGRDENNKGDGPGSTRTFKDVLERLRSVDATVFAVGLGTKLDQDVLERLALESGGEASFPADVSTLGDEFRRIVENLRKRYVISYTSTNSTRDGNWRKVEIQSTTPGVTAISRGGYFEPAN
jgi:Ca-activated chloride channel homolog